MRAFPLILVFLISLSTAAQPVLRLRNLTTKEGLSQNSINDLLEASDGRLWIATQDGLNSFDGRSFELYGAGSNVGTDLSDNFVWGLYEDTHGHIWASSRKGVNRVNPDNGHVTTFIQKPTDDVMAGMWGNNGRFCVVHEGYMHLGLVGHIYRFKLGTYNEDTLVQLSDEQIWMPEVDSLFAVDALVYKDQLVLRTGSGLVRAKGRSYEVMNLPRPIICTSQPNAFYIDREERLWVGGENGMLWYNGTTWSELNVSGQAIRNVHSVVQDIDGNLWIGTTNGVHVFDKGLQHLFHSRTNVDEGEEETYDLVHSLEICSDGTIWLGTANTGLKSFHWRTEQFKFLQNPTLTASDLVWSVEVVDGNKLVVGTNNGVEFFQLDTSNTSKGGYRNTVLSQAVMKWEESWMSSIPKVRVLSIATDQRVLYMGTAGDGLIRVDRSINRVKLIRFGTHHQNTVSEVVIDGDKIWCATQAGLYVLNKEGEVIEEYLLNGDNWDGPSVYFISAYNDGQGNVWLGSNYGFSRYVSATGKFEHYLYNKEELERGPAFNFVSGFARKENDLWIATYGGGLSHMDLSTGKFTHYDKNAGLSNNVCSGIQMDESGKLWLFNNGGVSRFNTQTKVFRNYSIGDGLIDNEFTLNSPSQAASGLIYAGTPSGLVLFNPQAIQVDRTLGNPRLAGLHINYESVGLSNQIDLYRGDKSITLDISVLRFFNREAISIKYKLVGYDDKWITSETDFVRATYTSLASGVYTLEAIVMNKDELEGEKVVLAVIEVHPPFWQEWWFIFIVSVLLLMLVILLVRYLARRKLKAKLEEVRVQRKLQAERERISRDLHDNVGAQLTYIISSLDNASYATAESDERTSEKLDALSDFSRNTMQQLRESIWVINSEEITVQEFTQRITGLGAKLIPEASTIEFGVGGENLNGVLNPSTAIHLLRIVQESVNNAVKHSNCEHIYIEIGVENHVLDLVIQDDGVGTANIEGKEGHHGMANIRERAELIDAVVEIISVPEQGTRVEVRNVQLNV